MDPEPGSSAQIPVNYISSLSTGLMQDGNVPLVYNRVGFFFKHLDHCTNLASVGEQAVRSYLPAMDITGAQ